jgi:hypothetical protein
MMITERLIWVSLIYIIVISFLVQGLDEDNARHNTIVWIMFLWFCILSILWISVALIFIVKGPI